MFVSFQFENHIMCSITWDSRLGKGKKSTYKAGSPETRVSGHAHRLLHAGAAKFLYGDADEGAQKGAYGGDELRTHSGALGEARLHEQGKIADLVGYLVEEDGDGGGGANGWRGIEACGHGQAVGNVVGKVGAMLTVSMTGR